MKLTRLVCPFLCLLLLSGCHKEEIRQNVNPQREAGITKQDLKYENTYIESISYPYLEEKEIDTAIQKTISAYHKKFLASAKNYKEERKAEFNVGYESYLKDQRYISVKLDIYQRIYQKQEYIETFVYDTKKKTMVHLYDIYDENKMSLLSDKVISYFKERFPDECDTAQFRSHTLPIEENYSKFVLKKDGIVFYFPQATLFEESATFPCGYQELADAIHLENETVPTYVPYEDILNEPVKNIDPQKPMVAMTFDDGPSKRYTAAILDALKEYNASATFFVLGSNANSAPELLQRMVLEGNEIGNHTFSHKQLTTLSKENIEEEIVATQESIYDITHKYPDVIRPPYGSKNHTVMECAKGKRLVTWTLDTRDWHDRNAKVIVDRVMKDVKDGDIILMHDLYASTAQAASILIPKLQEKGFQLVTVSELYTYRPQTKK